MRLLPTALALLLLAGAARASTEACDIDRAVAAVEREEAAAAADRNERLTVLLKEVEAIRARSKKPTAQIGNPNSQDEIASLWAYQERVKLASIREEVQWHHLAALNAGMRARDRRLMGLVAKAAIMSAKSGPGAQAKVDAESATILATLRTRFGREDFERTLPPRLASDGACTVEGEIHRAAADALAALAAMRPDVERGTRYMESLARKYPSPEGRLDPSRLTAAERAKHQDISAKVLRPFKAADALLQDLRLVTEMLRAGQLAHDAWAEDMLQYRHEPARVGQTIRAKRHEGDIDAMLAVRDQLHKAFIREDSAAWAERLAAIRSGEP
ncbi:MAG TPA: hypothetical protein VEH84_10940 [Alphaproteobacteria bacterium]|nr:hypothetical protein [Alphaproteobacteria bacterium]